MGAVGFTCWLVEAAIAGYWAQTAPHRGDIQDPSFMLEFGKIARTWDHRKVNARSLPLQNLNRKLNYLLVPVIMLGILSVFVEMLLDQYEAPLDMKLR